MRLPWLACAPLLLALLAFRTGSAPARAPVAPRTVILLRHAEKAPATAGEDARDPRLSAAGEARALALARLLAHSRPTRLVASEYRRTQATLAPLAAELGLTVELHPAAAPEALVAALAAAEPGSTWVVAGHSNTVPALAERLGVRLPDLEASPQGPVLGDAEYDRLFVLTLPPEEAGVSAGLVELRYGS